MTLLFCDGFDHYATADLSKKYTTVTGSPTISAAAGRRSTGGLTSGNTQNVTKTVTATASFVIGAAVIFSALPGASVAIISLLDAGTLQCDLRVNVDGTLSVTRNGTVLTNGTSTHVLVTGSYIEFKVTIADSIAADSCKVRVNGVDIITVATGQDTKNTANATANQVKLGQAAAGGFGSLVFDDFYICDQSGSTNNNFLGDVRIDTIFPNADGNYLQFTPSTGTDHYALVDETTPNTTDYNDGSTVGDRDSYALQNLTALTSQTVYGVQVNMAILKDDAGAKSASTMVRSSGTNGDGASAALGTSQTYVSQVYETDPNGSIAWTETTVNAMEAGCKVTA